MTGECLHQALGGEDVLIFEDRAQVVGAPRFSRLSLNDVTRQALQGLLIDCSPLVVIREDYWRRLRAALEQPPIQPEKLMAAANIVVETSRANSSFLGMKVLYDCPETGFRVLASESGRIVMTLSSDAFVVEDADGTLYRFGPFVVSLEANWKTKSSTIPVLAHPTNYVHWLPEFAPLRPLHLCDLIGELADHGSSLSKAVELLLGARRIIRSSLYGGTVYGDRPHLAGRRFASLRISKRDAIKQGLPIYPFYRHGERPPRRSQAGLAALRAAGIVTDRWGDT